jgi:hypothetical protein
MLADYMHDDHVSMMCWSFVLSEDAVYHKAVKHAFIYLHAGHKSVPRFIMMTEYGSWKPAYTDGHPKLEYKEASFIFYCAGGFNISKQ